MSNWIKFIFTALVLTCTSGCANAWRTSYIVGATSAKFITATHAAGWSEPLNETKTGCLSELDPETDTKAAFDECMGLYTAENNSKVVGALEKYDAAATVLEEALLATDPNDPRPNATKLLAAREDLLVAAADLLALFPKGEAYLDQLKMLTERVK